jgi:hypothetical protein
MSQAVDYMPSKHKALSLNPVPQKTSLKKQKTVASIKPGHSTPNQHFCLSNTSFMK